MKQTRREFILATATAAGALSIPVLALGAETRARAAAPSRILILGGTGFLGPACTESALARGHSVTHFTSGRTEERRKEGGRPSVVPAGVEQLYGNRDPLKTADDRRKDGSADAARDPNSPKGLTQLEGKKWDALIDTSGQFPRIVKASATFLAPNVRQYVYISSISVYMDLSAPKYNETALLHTLKDPAIEDMGKDFENYGGLKALCEKAAETSMPGRVTNIRPGYIVGHRDTSGRYLYWPVRASLGGRMAVPGSPQDPIQIIDVRDLADWIIHCIENRVTGIFNATGPEQELSMKSMLEGIQQGIRSETTPEWIDNSFLAEQGIRDGQFPLYAPPSGETAGFHRCDISKALAKGLQFRPVPDTAKSSFDWYKSLPSDIQARVAPQFAVHQNEEDWLGTEKRLLRLWAEKKAK